MRSSLSLLGAALSSTVAIVSAEVPEMGTNAVPADAAQLHPALSSGTTQWGGLKKAHRAHAAAHRRALAEQLADLSSLVGGEFTTLGINHLSLIHI